MNTENSETDKSNRFRYNFTNALNLKNSNANIALANLSIYYTWKNISLITKINLKFMLQLGMKHLIYLM